MDSLVELPISDAEWAQLHAQLCERIPSVWEKTHPRDVLDMMMRLGDASKLVDETGDERLRIQADVEATRRVLVGNLRSPRSDEELWPTLRAIGLLGIPSPHTATRLLMLGLEMDGRTAVELAHAFARIGIASNGVATHLLHMHLSAQSPDARHAARQALVHLGPPSTAEVLDVLASFPPSSPIIANGDDRALSSDDDVFNHVRRNLRQLLVENSRMNDTEQGHLRVHEGVTEASTSWATPVTSTNVDDRAALQTAIEWMLREAVPAKQAA